MTSDQTQLPPNPKAAYGAQKPDLSLIPPVSQAHAAMAFEVGDRKYGAYNWRDKAVEARTYVAAAQRHIGDWLDGAETAADSGVHNLGHAIACLAILLDAQEQGNLIDNRPIAGRSADVLERLKAQKIAAQAPVAGVPPGGYPERRTLEEIRQGLREDLASPTDDAWGEGYEACARNVLESLERLEAPAECPAARPAVKVGDTIEVAPDWARKVVTDVDPVNGLISYADGCCGRGYQYRVVAPAESCRPAESRRPKVGDRVRFTHTDLLHLNAFGPAEVEEDDGAASIPLFVRHGQGCIWCDPGDLEVLP